MCLSDTIELYVYIFEKHIRIHNTQQFAVYEIHVRVSQISDGLNDEVCLSQIHVPMCYIQTVVTITSLHL